jgi:hypothetical protein
VTLNGFNTTLPAGRSLDNTIVDNISQFAVAALSPTSGSARAT